MPRARKPGSGGPRVGAPATAYANRSDLNAAPLPVQAATGQPYGAAGAQIAAQRQVPIAPTPLAPPQPQGQPAGPLGAPPQQPPPPVPGSFGPLLRGTERPAEPVTSGLPVGPGPGPEALGGLGGQTPTPNISDMLRQASQSVGSTALGRLADMAQSLGQ